MALIEIDRNPSRRNLLIFVALLPVFFGIVGAIRWHAGSTRTAEALWIFGLVVSLIALAFPPARRWLYLGWVYATYPIGWVVSHVLLVAIYALVATPTALVLRSIGRDPMLRGFDRSAASYWVQRETGEDRNRYFRQF